MRDPKRIPKLLIRLGELWEKYPDLRLGQLIGNYVEGSSLYYIEDNELLDVLEEFYGEKKKAKKRS